ncbi:MAG: rRNA maturation RNase YbeY [Bdellovibrionales bacterium]
MLVELVDAEKSPLSLDFLSRSLEFLKQGLIQKKIIPDSFEKKIIIVFLSQDSMRDLNNTFLNKNHVTDVLSFAPMEQNYLGEIALCEDKIKEQSKSHNLTFEQEAIYLILHALLHLLGFHHEQGGEEARQMFKIQDDLFEKWLHQLERK